MLRPHIGAIRAWVGRDIGRAETKTLLKDWKVAFGAIFQGIVNEI